MDEGALIAMGFPAGDVRAIIAELPADAHMQQAVDRLIACTVRSAFGEATAGSAGELGADSPLSLGGSTAQLCVHAAFGASAHRSFNRATDTCLHLFLDPRRMLALRTGLMHNHSTEVAGYRVAQCS